MLVKLAAVVLLLLLVVACGSDPISEGYIRGKEQEPERSWVVMIPISTGKTTVLIPLFHFDDEDWRLDLESCRKGTEECKTGSVYVSQETFDKATVGAWYSAKPEDSLTDDVQKVRQ